MTTKTKAMKILSNLFKKKESSIEKLKIECLSRIKIIEEYKLLSLQGKYEVFICCSFLALHSSSFSNDLKISYVNLVLDSMTDFKIDKSRDEMMSIINSRIQFYDSEMSLFFKSEGKHILGKIYNIFYEEPLSQHPNFSQNLPEILPFTMSFMDLMRESKLDV
ncbi:MAG: hypothetical protein COA88_12910 [Kordia sp.]|nr:MAG: hypothetical protein COA88_12910 [Kordia sp.]